MKQGEKQQIPTERVVFILVLAAGIIMMMMGKGWGGFWTTIVGIIGWGVTKFFDEEK